MSYEQAMYDLDGWAQVPCNVADMLVRQDTVKLTVFSSLTDLHGTYGRPLVYTEWGATKPDQAVLREYRYPESDRPCEHWVNTKENAERVEEDDE